MKLASEDTRPTKWMRRHVPNEELGYQIESASQAEFVQAYSPKLSKKPSNSQKIV